MNNNQKELLIQLIQNLNSQKNTLTLNELSEKKLMADWRGLVNQQPTDKIEESYLVLEDSFLREINQQKSIRRLSDCQKTPLKFIYFDHGDICDLQVDAIVNAANSYLLGCFIPNHHCIDNAIHTYAGLRLRLACDSIMQAQNHKEPVGQAKITSAYHLPAKKIIHTVGPRIDPQKGVTPIRAQLLRNSYLSCLQLAEKEKLNSLAFCPISTGEFGFPKEAAARIAIETVRQWQMKSQSSMNIIFNTFDDENKQIYHHLLIEGASHDDLDKS